MDADGLNTSIERDPNNDCLFDEVFNLQDFEFLGPIVKAALGPIAAAYTYERLIKYLERKQHDAIMQYYHRQQRHTFMENTRAIIEKCSDVPAAHPVHIGFSAPSVMSGFQPPVDRHMYSPVLEPLDAPERPNQVVNEKQPSPFSETPHIEKSVDKKGIKNQTNRRRILKSPSYDSESDEDVHSPPKQSKKVTKKTPTKCLSEESDEDDHSPPKQRKKVTKKTHSRCSSEESDEDDHSLPNQSKKVAKKTRAKSSSEESDEDVYSHPKPSKKVSKKTPPKASSKLVNEDGSPPQREKKASRKTPSKSSSKASGNDVNSSLQQGKMALRKTPSRSFFKASDKGSTSRSQQEKKSSRKTPSKGSSKATNKDTDSFHRQGKKATRKILSKSSAKPKAVPCDPKLKTKPLSATNSENSKKSTVAAATKSTSSSQSKKGQNKEDIPPSRSKSHFLDSLSRLESRYESYVHCDLSDEDPTPKQKINPKKKPPAKKAPEKKEVLKEPSKKTAVKKTKSTNSRRPAVKKPNQKELCLQEKVALSKKTDEPKQNNFFLSDSDCDLSVNESLSDISVNSCMQSVLARSYLNPGCVTPVPEDVVGGALGSSGVQSDTEGDRQSPRKRNGEKMNHLVHRMSKASKTIGKKRVTNLGGLSNDENPVVQSIFKSVTSSKHIVTPKHVKKVFRSNRDKDSDEEEESDSD